MLAVDACTVPAVDCRCGCPLGDKFAKAREREDDEEPDERLWEGEMRAETPENVRSDELDDEWGVGMMGGGIGGDITFSCRFPLSL